MRGVITQDVLEVPVKFRDVYCCALLRLINLKTLFIKGGSSLLQCIILSVAKILATRLYASISSSGRYQYTLGPALNQPFSSQ